MNTRSSLSQTIRKEFFNKNIILITLPIAISYALLTLYLFNYRLILQTWFGYFPLQYKITLMIALLQGFQTLFSTFDLALLSITSLLVGLNCMIAFSAIQKIKQQGTITVSIGGASIIGLAAAGCGACGLSLFSVFGLSAAVSFLPFHGLILHIVALLLLSTSLLYMIKKLHEEVYCKIPRANTR
jgi:hypothetical protein